MAFHDADGRSYDFSRAGLGLNVLQATFVRVFERALDSTNPQVVRWPGDIPIPLYPREHLLATLKSVLTMVLAANLSDVLRDVDPRCVAVRTLRHGFRRH